MTPQLEEAQRLFRLALRDQETFAPLLPLPRASLAAIGFHAQQAVEKALKVIAVLRGIEFRYDDEVTPEISREELEFLLLTVIKHAGRLIEGARHTS